MRPGGVFFGGTTFARLANLGSACGTRERRLAVLRDSSTLAESEGLGAPEDVGPANRPSVARDVGGVSGTSFEPGWLDEAGYCKFDTADLRRYNDVPATRVGMRS